MASKLLSSRARWRLVSSLVLPFALSLGAASAWARSYSNEELRHLERTEESQVRQLREQEVNQLRIALGRRSPMNRRADLYLRLAEIYMESYRAEFLLEGRAHEARLASGEKDPLIDRAHSKVFLHDGIRACQEVLGFRISYEHLDEIYYFLAFNFGELGDRKQSLLYFEKLVRDFPKSAMVFEGYRQLGDSSFGSKDFRKALQYYELAVRKAPPDAVPSLHHKMAWCFYRTRQYDRAVDSMRLAVEATSRSKEKYLSLREEALRDMAVFMTDSGRVDEAIQYFQKVAGDRSFYPKLLEKLGREYERNVEPAKAVQVYESLLKTNPDSETRFRVQVKLIDLDLRRGKFREVLVRIEEISNPSQYERSDTETQVAAQNLRAMIRRTATESHERYRKNQNKVSLETAESYYEIYLSRFLKNSDSHRETPEIQMYLAEVKRELGKAKDASQLYRAVVETRDPRYAKEAGALWTASLSEAIRKNSTNSPKTVGNRASEPSELEKEYIEAADRLQDALGETSEGREAALKAAEVEAGYKGSQDSSIKRLRALIKSAPQSPQALTAARLWIQIYTDQLGEKTEVPDELKDSIQKAVIELKENSTLMTSDRDTGRSRLKALIEDQEIRLRVTAIARNEKEKNYAEAAKGYESFAKDSSQRELAEKAYANALINYGKSQDATSVLRVSEAWVKRYHLGEKTTDKSTGKFLEAARGSATQLLIQGQFEASAQEFTLVGSLGLDAAALETAARIYEGMGSLEQARTSWLSALEKFPKSPSVGQTYLKLARSYESQRDDANSAKYFGKCMEVNEFSAECAARLGDLKTKGEDFAAARTAYKKAASAGSKKGGNSPWIGYARFRLAEKMEKEGRFDPLQLPEAQLKRSMDQRAVFLESLNRAYVNAVEAGGPWAVGALNALASWATHFADEIEAITPPARMRAADVEKFRSNLRNFSEPLRKKAISTWTEAYSKAVAAESFSPVLPDIADHLASFRVATPARAQGPRGRFRLFGVPADGAPEGREASISKVREKLLKNPKETVSWVDYGNLLWGTGKPKLSQLCYDYALTLQQKNAGALNNRGVLSINDGEEDWYAAFEASQFFHEAIKKDEFFLPAKVNLATLMNYYRLFSKSKPYWEQIRARVQSPDIELGLAIAQQGVGEISPAEASFKRAAELGAQTKSFAILFHEAARQSFDATQAGLAGKKCLGTLGDVTEATWVGFEKSASESLKRACTQWSSTGSH